MNTTMHPRHVHYARATARVAFGAAVREALEGSDILHVARIAAVLAARRAGEVVPYTPAVEMTAVEVEFVWVDEGLRIEVLARGVSRQGLSTRVLLAASVCAVTVADMLPDFVHAISIDETRVVETGGGAAGLNYRFDPALAVAVLVVSDAVLAGKKQDRAGAIVREEVERLRDHGVLLAAQSVVADDSATIREAVLAECKANRELILCVGGTGLTHTDTTVEAVEPLLERSIPGLMEASRSYGQEQTPLAFMSRGVAGLRDDTLIVTLPGSRSGAREALQAISPSMLHIVHVLRRSRAELVGTAG